MLTLQRASAGSGKTFTLTKKYIMLLISIALPDGTLRLRNDAELADSVRHILAVTFTNKATNEMKERILRELDILAFPSADSTFGKQSDYLDEFKRLFHADADAIRDVCRTALRYLLYEYQDFNISTIDSYFQSILRTFSYESDLPDNFQVVIDSDYLVRSSVNSLLDDLEHGNLPAEEEMWLRRLMKQNLESGHKGWNVFQRSESKTSVFGNICEMAKNMDKEEFKPVLEALDSYFSHHESLYKACAEIEDSIQENLDTLFASVRTAARDVIDAYDSLGGAGCASIIFGKSRTFSTLSKMTAADADPTAPLKWPSEAPEGKKLFASGTAKDILAQGSDVEAPVRALCEAVSCWLAYLDSEYRLWRLYSESLPSLALMQDLRRRVDTILQDCDSVNLADTNTMLRKIIADDDVPFVYERMGTRLNHFLIDEFQDTSHLQWLNFRPLLRESESRGNANLIIGDAKQSIYRFRNAEPRLILHAVPEEFPDHEERGFSEADNTNWRSFRNIVYFNNYLFKSLAHRLCPGIEDLYGNTVQRPNAEEDQGYVRIDFYDKEKADDDDADDRATLSPAALEMTGQRVISLLQRGYRQGEIAVLVSSNKAGREVIASLMALNDSLPPDIPPLQMVSEESLTLSSSMAVNTVMECFRAIRNGMNGKLKRDAEAAEKAGTRMQWRDISDYYRLVSSRHPGLSLVDKMKECLKFAPVYDTLSSIVENMQALTLPSLTEAIIGRFVDPESRRAQAPFLAALQDAILDYCEIYPADVASLLRWWDTTGKNISISSPDGIDAINVMTIHKSKGLEFPCVILPEINTDFRFRKERIWARVLPNFRFAAQLPEILPVMITGDVKDTPYKAIYDELLYLRQMDSINRLYVALTRAACELYLIMPAPEEPSAGKSATKKSDADDEASYLKFNRYVRMILNPATGDTDETLPYLLSTSDLKIEESGSIAYGNPVENVKQSLQKIRDRNTTDKNAVTIEDYYVNNDSLNIICKEEDDSEPDIDLSDEDRIDPRSEGNLLHNVLQRVVTASDLPRAVQKMQTRGLVSDADAAGYITLLGDAIAAVAERHWFDGRYRVLTERDLLDGHRRMLRPDRIMLSHDGKEAVILDYKFGTSDGNSAHHRQLKGYMHRLRSALPSATIRAYLWYIREHKIEEVSLRPDSDN